MFKPKQVILIPHWVQEILGRHQLNLDACLDFEKIKPLMSLNDLVSFSALQQYAAKLTGTDVTLGSLMSVWIEKVPQGNRDTIDYLTKSIVPLEGDASFRTELESRLFTGDCKQSCYKEPFITYDLSPDVIGVVVYPGFFVDENNVALQKSLIEAILKVLYVYNTYSEVASLPLFKRYLELLSNRKIIV